MNSLYEQLLIALHGVWRRRWLALGVAWAIALVGWLVVSLVPNTYQSTARILVQPRSMLSDAVGTTAAERQQNIDAVRQTLTSADSLKAIVEETALSGQIANERDKADAIAMLSKAVKVVPELDNVLKISVGIGRTGLSSADNAQLSKQIVDKLIGRFVDGNLSDNRVETGQTIDFLDRQIALRGKELAAAEAKRGAFEQKYMALLPGAGTIADRIAAGRSEMARIDGELAAAQSALAAVRGQLAATPASTRSAGAVMAPSAGSNIQAQIADGRARGWTDQHPDMVALREQLSRVGGAGGGGSSTIVSANPMYVSLRSMLAEKQAVAGALAARKGQIQGQINAVIAEQSANPQVAAEQTEVDRAYQVLKAQYDKLLADREDVKLRGDAQGESAAVKFSVIDAPTVPQKPVSPDRPLLLTLVLVVALGGGIGAAFAAGQLQATFASATALARTTGLPVLGSVHEVVTEALRAERAKRMKMFNGGAAGLIGIYALLVIVEFVQRGTLA